jgi:hypothetical protein
MANTISRKRLIELYLPPDNEFVMVDVPEMKFVMIDGEGSPENEAHAIALKWLFAAVYPIRRIARQRMGKNFVEPPLEGLWWTDDMADFVAGNKDKLKWRMMIPGPDWADGETVFQEAVKEAAQRLGEPPGTLRLDTYAEGKSVQIMHTGPYNEHAARAILTRLHGEFLVSRNLAPNGPHHEIYLTDPERTAPENMKTVLRQPVRPA